MSEQIRRYAYVLNDVETAKNSTDGLKAHEILLDYNNDNSLIIVDEDLNTWSLGEFIKNISMDFLKKDHIKTSNQHLKVTEKNDGFMTSDLYKTLLKSNDNIDEVISMIDELCTTSPVIVHSLSYTIIDKKCKLDIIIKNGPMIIKINDEIIISEKPSDKYENIYGKIGFRDDLIGVSFTPDQGFKLKYINDVYISDDMIKKDKEYKYDNESHVYGDDKDFIVPILKVSRKNSSPVSISNIYGNLTDSYIDDYELIDICRYKIPNISLQKILTDNMNNINNNKVLNIDSIKQVRTNITRKLPNLICYIPMNSTCIDSISKTSLSKNMTFRNSPYGKMMNSAINKGEIISFNRQTEFIFEFMIDNRDIVDENNIINLSDDEFNQIINFSVKDDNVCINNEIIWLDKSKNYNFISILVDNLTNIVKVYVDNNFVRSISLNTFKNISMITVPCLNNAIGELLLTDDINYMNSDIMDKSLLVPKFNAIHKVDKFKERDITFKLTDKLDNMLQVVDKSELNKFIKGDSLYLYFNNEIIDSILPSFIIEDVVFNKIKVTGHNFKTGDILSIFKDVTEISELYMVDNVDNEFIYLDKVLEGSFIGYYINNINDVTGITLYAGDNIINNVVNMKNLSYVTFTEDVSTSNDFRVKYLEKYKAQEYLNNIKSILSVNVNGAIYSKGSNVIKLEKSRLPIVFNGERTTLIGNDVFINDIIEISITVQLKDFISFSNIPFDILNKILKVSANIVVSSGSNTLHINDYSFNRGNVLSEYEISNIQYGTDGEVNISIKTSNDVKAGKLLLDDISLTLTLDGEDLFYVKDNNGTVTSFLLVSEEGIYTNIINNELQITFYNNTDNYYTLNDYKDITENYNGCKLITNKNNILKMINVDSDKVYDLEKNYIL